MRDNLVGENRFSFFDAVLDLALAHDVKALVVIEDRNHQTALGGPDHELDATKLFLERLEPRLATAGRHGLVIVARPAGGSTDDMRLLSECFETLQRGTDYVRWDRLVTNVLTTPFKHVRSLQLADLVVSVATAFIAGQEQYSGPLFPKVRDMLYTELGRRGGCGLKIHPDFRYRNLYHWLLGDREFVRQWSISQLPFPNMPYGSGPAEARASLSAD